jgi:hypothetical protein
MVRGRSEAAMRIVQKKMKTHPLEVAVSGGAEGEGHAVVMDTSSKGSSTRLGGSPTGFKA